MRTFAHGEADKSAATGTNRDMHGVTAGRGDAYAEAASDGDCTPISTVMRRATGMDGAVMAASSDFGGRVQMFDLGALRLCHVTCDGPMKVDGRDVVELDWLSGGPVHVLVVLSGALTIHWMGRSSIQLQAQEWCALTQIGKFWAEADGPVEFLAMVAPGEELHSVVGGVARFSGRPAPADCGAPRVLRLMLAEVIAQAPLLDAPSRLSLANALVQTLKAAIFDLAKAPGAPAQEQLYQRVCDLVESSLGREDLSIDYIAQRLNCSKRYLHALFSRHNAERTLNDYINHRRLNRCRAELLIGGGRSIAEVAHRWGFQDPSYFARLFRREYGVSPSSFLADAGEGALQIK
jgi:AraC-like DNA-binding protein